MPDVIYSPPGDDPTLREHDMPGPRLSSCLLRLALIAVVIAGIVFGVGLVTNTQSKKAPATATEWQPTAYPTYTPYPTYTQPAPAPSATYTGVWTPLPTVPTRTSIPTYTPWPTATPTATLLPPGFLATWTPGPWIITRYAATHETFTPTPDPVTLASPGPTRTATKRKG